jgi:hypothetical protein
LQKGCQQAGSQILASKDGGFVRRRRLGERK